mmetsp:Transcript_34949/g.69392  ORF Transcript_34949/g.69392 Transcript_34949/m.69392 type:complete len:257 (+) Transcript_34949:65-835(+)
MLRKPGSRGPGKNGGGSVGARGHVTTSPRRGREHGTCKPHAPRLGLLRLLCLGGGAHGLELLWRLLGWQLLILEALPTMVLDPLLLYLRRVAEDFLAVVGHDLLRLRIVVAAAVVIGALGDRRGRGLVRQERLARGLQPLQNLRVEAAVALRDILPILVLIKQAIVEHVVAFDGVASVPSCLIAAAVRVHQRTLAMELALAELALVDHAVRELEAPLALEPLVLVRALVGRPAPGGHGGELGRKRARQRAQSTTAT